MLLGISTGSLFHTMSRETPDLIALGISVNKISDRTREAHLKPTDLIAAIGAAQAEETHLGVGADLCCDAG